MPLKVKMYKFAVTDKETNQTIKYHFTKEIEDDLGMCKGSIYNLINKSHTNNRKKWSKYNIEKIREPYIYSN